MLYFNLLLMVAVAIMLTLHIHDRWRIPLIGGTIDRFNRRVERWLSVNVIRPAIDGKKVGK